MGLLSTIALWGLLALAIPVLIHLVNPGKGKLVWVGDIKLLKGVKNNRVNELKIKRWLLLLVRLLILTLLVLLMAKPYIYGQLKLFGGKTILVSEDWLTASDAKQRESLGDYHVLSPNHVWQQLAMWHQKTEYSTQFDVYAFDCIDSFESAVKPQFNRQINWYLTPCSNKPVAGSSKTLTLIADTPDKRLLAALNAIKVHAMPMLKVQVVARQNELNGASDWYIYQNEQKLEVSLLEQVAKGRILLVVGGEGETKPWGEGSIVPFSLEGAHSGAFPEQLLSVLNQHLPFSQRVGELSLGDAQLQITPGEDATAEQKVAVERYLIYLLLILWLIERFIAERRDRVYD